MSVSPGAGLALPSWVWVGFPPLGSETGEEGGRGAVSRDVLSCKPTGRRSEPRVVQCKSRP